MYNLCCYLFKQDSTHNVHLIKSETFVVLLLIFAHS